MLQNKRMRNMAVLGGFCAAALLTVGLFVPVRLSVSYPDTVYAGQVLTEKDVQVTAKSLFGVSLTGAGSSFEASEDNKELYCQSGYLRKTIHPNVIDVKSMTASYDGSLYAGQLPAKDKIQVKAMYEDGTEASLEVLSVGNQPVANTDKPVTIQVQTQAGSVDIKDLSVVRLTELKASYVGTAYLGERFFPSRVQVSLLYPDGTSFRTQQFVVHDRDNVSYDAVKEQPDLLRVSSYLDGDVSLYVLTPYGTTMLSVHPEKGAGLTASYEQDVLYEGDELSEDKISVVQGEQAVSDFLFENPGPLLGSCTIRIPTRYGLAQLPVSVVPVTSVSADIGNAEEGDTAEIESLTFVYEDGVERDVDADEVTFLNLPEKWKEKQTVWFVWNGKEYSTEVNTLSQFVKDSRGEYKGTGYDVSEEILKNLTLLCQRLCNDNLKDNQAEMSLILNRYELYGNGQDLWEYVLNDGYWGDSESIQDAIQYSSPYDDVLAVLKDMIKNGYRTLPLYVDERVSGVDGLSEDDIISDGLRFYGSSDTLNYGYTEDAYKKVEKKDPPKREVKEPEDETDTDDSGIQIESMG